MTNLVANAVKYGEGKPIEVELSADEERARIAVRDQGIGIGSKEQARIFGRFERAVSPRQYGGFGLGLWIARQVVEASGGRIAVNSEVGKGGGVHGHPPTCARSRSGLCTFVPASFLGAVASRTHAPIDLLSSGSAARPPAAYCAGGTRLRGSD